MRSSSASTTSIGLNTRSGTTVSKLARKDSLYSGEDARSEFFDRNKWLGRQLKITQSDRQDSRGCLYFEDNSNGQEDDLDRRMNENHGRISRDPSEVTFNYRTETDPSDVSTVTSIIVSLLLVRRIHILERMMTKRMKNILGSLVYRFQLTVVICRDSQGQGQTVSY